MARTIDIHGNVRDVRDLGWLLRHGSEVTFFLVTPGFRGNDATLTAYISGGTRYVTQFASKDVLWNFLHRPKWFGLSVDWYGTQLDITKG